MNTLHTRRSFLKKTALGTSLSSTLPGFLCQTIDRLHAEASANSDSAMRTGRDHPILVVLQWAGGNDGLNTVVPIQDDHYRRARPKLAIPKKSALTVSDSFGLHPALGDMQRLFDAGQLAVIHGVGYPNPNRSHFRSTEIWETATDSHRFETTGWIGRYFDAACSGADPSVGLAIGRQRPQSFQARNGQGLVVANPGNLRAPAASAHSGMDAEREEPSGGMQGMDIGESGESGETDETGSGSDLLGETVLDMNSGASIGEMSRHGTADGDLEPLAFLERMELQARVGAAQIQQALKQGRNEAGYPNSALANQLRSVARLIAGGLGCRIYHVNQGGYDTHTQQAGTHERLLREFSQAVFAFQQDLRSLGVADQVLLMTFSEFGRRVQENASGGTDHGAAAPLLLIGNRIHAGFHGTPPDLRPKKLVNGDPLFTTDFRSIYATLLQDWLGTGSNEILKGSFPTLRLVRT